MTSIRSLVAEFEQAGGALALQDGKVKARYPDEQKDAVTPILSGLREHREEVVRLLRERSTRSVTAPRTIQHGPVRARIIGQERTEVSDTAERCFHCGASGQCRCAVCCGVDRRGRTTDGECRSCSGTGHILFRAAQ